MKIGNDGSYISTDSFNWTLNMAYESTNKQGETSLKFKETHYGTLGFLLNKYIDLQAHKEFDADGSVAHLLDSIDNAREDAMDMIDKGMAIELKACKDEIRLLKVAVSTLENKL